MTSEWKQDSKNIWYRVCYDKDGTEHHLYKGSDWTLLKKKGTEWIRYPKICKKGRKCKKCSFWKNWKTCKDCIICMSWPCCKSQPCHQCKTCRICTLPILRGPTGPTGPTGPVSTIMPYEIVRAGPTGLFITNTSMSYLDTEDSTGTFILPDAPVGTIKDVTLYQRRSNNAYVQTSRGSILLSPEKFSATLQFVTDSWRVIQYPLSDNMYPSRLDARIIPSTVNVANSVSLSDDGNTLVIGIPGPASPTSHVFVYYRTGPGTWVQDPFLFIGSGTAQNQEGMAVMIDSDADFLAVGAPQDNGGVGAVWIYMRNSGVWSQQAKIIGTGNIGSSLQGSAIAINSSGDVIAIGGPGDNSNNGAVWIFNLVGMTWTQIIKLSIAGGNLSGSAISNPALIGTSLSMDPRNQFLAIGGPNDSSITTAIGAVWVISTLAGVWEEQIFLSGAAVATVNGTIGFNMGARYGQSVALRADGQGLAVGVPGDSQIAPNFGCIWVSQQTLGKWDPEGTAGIGTGATGAPQQGIAVAVSADGNTLVFSGATDGTSGQGAVWVIDIENQTYEQISKITLSGTTGFGSGLALSSNGNTMACGSIGETDIYI